MSKNGLSGVKINLVFEKFENFNFNPPLTEQEGRMSKNFNCGIYAYVFPMEIKSYGPLGENFVRLAVSVKGKPQTANLGREKSPPARPSGPRDEKRLAKGYV